MEKNEKIEIMRLKEISGTRVRIDHMKQSFMLAIRTIREWMTGGRRNSPTSTLAATSPRAMKLISELLEIDKLVDGQVVVEFGTGPGPGPQKVLSDTRADIIYLAIELNESFADHLRNTVNDDRLIVVTDSATNIERILKEQGINKKVSRILSSLPMSRDKEATEEILEASKKILSNDGLLGMWNFTPTSINMVADAFGHELCEITKPWWALFLRIIIAKKPQQQHIHNLSFDKQLKKGA